MNDYYLYLSEPGVYIPPDTITNADLEKIVGTSDKWIVSRTGIRERRISYDKNAKQMGIESAKNLLDKIKIPPNEIDEIIFCTNNHAEQKEFPNHASYVAEQLGITKDIPTHDESEGCTGPVYGIRMARNILIGEPDKINILVAGAEHLTDITDYSDRNTCVLFGDAAVCWMVSRKKRKNNEEGIIKTFVSGRPDKNDYLSLEYKLGKKIRRLTDPSKKFELYKKRQNYLVMNGPEVFKFATEVMREATHKVIEGTGYELKDIDVIIPHGANIRIVRQVEIGLKKKGFHGEIFTNLEKYGNTSTASTGLAQEEAVRLGIIKKGSLYVIVKFGAGFTYGAILARHEQESYSMSMAT